MHNLPMLNKNRFVISLCILSSLSAVGFYAWYLFLHAARVGTESPRALTWLGISTIVLALLNFILVTLLKGIGKHLATWSYVICVAVLVPFAITACMSIIMALPFIFSR